MTSVKWIRLTISMFDDEKIKLIQSMPEGDALLVIWVRLLVLAGKVNDGGFIYLSEGIPYTDEMLSTIFQKPLNTTRLALSIFAQFGMIEMTARGIFLPSWQETQNVEGLEKIQEQTRKRVAAHREKGRTSSMSHAPYVTLPVTQCNVTCNATVTQCNATDIDLDIDLEYPPIVPPEGGGECHQNRVAAGNGTSPVEHSTTPDSVQGFNEFWTTFPKKVNKGAAESAWRKLKPSDALISEILSAIETAKRSRQWQRDGGQYIPHPATWLNQRRWEDETPAPAYSKSFSVGSHRQQTPTDSHGKFDEAEIILRRIRQREAEERVVGMYDEGGFVNSS